MQKTQIINASERNSWRL